MSLDDWLRTQADQRERDGLVRTLKPRDVRSNLLDLAGNDYLGLSRDPRVTAASSKAALEWGPEPVLHDSSPGPSRCTPTSSPNWPG
jgi:8-amino-7-oxononanoate synthase